ncbi:MAG: NeuD/PglB/VioB family sugar acetyltransferase [Chloroflexota bacterium]
MATAINIPLLNPNETEALLAALHVQEGQYVQEGEPLCTLETTKSTAEVEAPISGYVIGLRLEAGQMVCMGDLLCYLSEDVDWEVPEDETVVKEKATQAQIPERGSEEVPEGVRITQPALRLALAHKLDFSQFPTDRFITEDWVRAQVETLQKIDKHTPYDPSAILVYGGGGHGKSVIDLLRVLETYTIVGVVDDGLPVGEHVMGVPVIGGGEVLAEWRNRGVGLAVNAVGGVGDLASRLRVYQLLAQVGYVCPTVVHPMAVVEHSARLSGGVQVFPHAYVGSDVGVGFGVIINTGAIVSHDCVLEEYSNISPGAILAGGVRVGERALIGMGVTVNLYVNIGARARVGNGATVKSDVPEGGLVRAGHIWPPESQQ